MQPGLHGLGAQAEAFSGFLDRAFLDFAHEEHQAVVLGQVVDRAFEQPADLAPRRAGHGILAAEAAGESQHAPGLALRGLDLLHVHRRAARAQASARLVQHDPGEPGQHRGVAAESVQVLEGIDIGGLHHVLGFGVVVDHAARDPEQALVAAPDDLQEGLAPAATGQFHQRGFAQFVEIDVRRRPDPRHRGSSRPHPIRCASAREVPAGVGRKARIGCG